MASKPAQPGRARGVPAARASCARRTRSSSSVRSRRAARWRIYRADCLQALPRLAADSVDAIITDPPYGLEFMGKEWDSFRSDDPGTNRNRGEHAGSHGTAEGGGENGHPARGKIAVAYGGGKRAGTFRCTGCGKRDQFRNEHTCGPSTRWARELIDPFAAPPTMLAFQNWSREWALAAMRVLKPGGHLLAFGGTRTFHRLTCALEDAGFEIRDCMCWLYGQGFPKSLNVTTAIHKTQGEPRTRGGGEWRGWGTALKPAWEPIVLARKPLGGTVAQNVCKHGTGALNIDGCRITPQPATDAHESETENRHAGERPHSASTPGRWPANVILSHTPDCRHTGHTRTRSSCHHPAARGKGGLGTAGHKGQRGLPERSSTSELIGRWECPPYCAVRMLDEQSGGVSRFFYCPKASSRERNAGLDAHEQTTAGDGRKTPIDNPYQRGKTPRQNIHPTVKPIALMRHLVRLVTPPGGIVLDPFTGSGSTGIAAVIEGARFLGIEREAEYIPIARARIKHWARPTPKHTR